MPQAAHVQSRLAIDRFRAALLAFADRCQGVVDELNAEVRRLADWLEHDRPAYWKEQIRSAKRHTHEAEQALERCLVVRISGERPACREERVALARAKQRLTEAHARAERARHWRGELRHEQVELRGRLGQIARLAEHNIPQAVATLDQVLQRLDEYTQARTGPVQARSAAAPPQPPPTPQPQPLSDGADEGTA